MSVELYRWDCMKLMPKLPAAVAELVLTDIPYGEVNRESGGLREFNKGAADVVTFDLKDFLLELIRLCRGSLYIFCGLAQISRIHSILRNKGLTTRLCVWEKTNPSPMNGGKLWLNSMEYCVFARKKGAVFSESCKSPLWRLPTGKSGIHPTQKPLALFEQIVTVSSSEKGIVLDPCMGSGTSGCAAVRLGRSFIGIELDKRYFAFAKQRIKRYQGIRVDLVLPKYEKSFVETIAEGM